MCGLCSQRLCRHNSQIRTNIMHYYLQAYPPAMQIFTRLNHQLLTASCCIFTVLLYLTQQTQTSRMTQAVNCTSAFILNINTLGTQLHSIHSDQISGAELNVALSLVENWFVTNQYYTISNMNVTATPQLLCNYCVLISTL